MPMPAFAPVESPKYTGLAEEVGKGLEVEAVGVSVTGAFAQRDWYVFCYAVLIVAVYQTCTQIVPVFLFSTYIALLMSSVMSLRQYAQLCPLRSSQSLTVYSLVTGQQQY